MLLAGLDRTIMFSPEITTRVGICFGSGAGIPSY
jgi:hypothetical protein